MQVFFVIKIVDVIFKHMAGLIEITNNNKKLAQELQYDSYAKPLEINLDKMAKMAIWTYLSFVYHHNASDQ